MSNDHVARLTDQRNRAWEQAKTLLDGADAESRDLTAEEAEQFDRINADIDALDARRAAIVDTMRRDQAIGESRAALGLPADLGTREVAQPAETDADIIRAIARGERRSHSFEQRDLATSSTGAPVPTSFYNQLVQHLIVQGPMLDPSVVTMLTTQSGENLQIPRTSGYTAPAATAEGSAIGESDAAFSAFVTLGAFKYAATFQLTRELVEDSGVDLLSFVADQAGRGMGTAVNAALTTGTGTVQPKGVVSAAASAVTGGTGVAGVPTVDNLVDLVYAVPSPYRRTVGRVGFQMRASTVAAIRKLKDVDGQYLWQPSTQAGQPDTLLGFPIWENPDVAATATGAKSVIFGDFSRYIVRQVRGIDFARDDSVGFVNDLITFRITWRGDGNLPDTGNSIVYYKGGAS